MYFLSILFTLILSACSITAMDWESYDHKNYLEYEDALMDWASYDHKRNPKLDEDTITLVGNDEKSVTLSRTIACISKTLKESIEDAQLGNECLENGIGLNCSSRSLTLIAKALKTLHHCAGNNAPTVVGWSLSQFLQSELDHKEILYWIYKTVQPKDWNDLLLIASHLDLPLLTDIIASKKQYAFTQQPEAKAALLSQLSESECKDIRSNLMPYLHTDLQELKQFIIKLNTEIPDEKLSEIQIAENPNLPKLNDITTLKGRTAIAQITVQHNNVIAKLRIETLVDKQKKFAVSNDAQFMSMAQKNPDSFDIYSICKPKGKKYSTYEFKETIDGTPLEWSSHGALLVFRTDQQIIVRDISTGRTVIAVDIPKSGGIRIRSQPVFSNDNKYLAMIPYSSELDQRRVNKGIIEINLVDIQAKKIYAIPATFPMMVGQTICNLILQWSADNTLRLEYRALNPILISNTAAWNLNNLDVIGNYFNNKTPPPLEEIALLKSIINQARENSTKKLQLTTHETTIYNKIGGENRIVGDAIRTALAPYVILQNQ